MPHQPCTVCTHEVRAEIDRGLRLGEPSIRALARQFGVSKSAIDRHRAHIALKKPAANKQQIEQIDAQILKLSRAERHARKRRDTKSALAYQRELRSWVVLRGRAEAAGAEDAPDSEQVSPTEALRLAQAIVEASVASSNQDVITWLCELASRFQAINNTVEGSAAE